MPIKPTFVHLSDIHFHGNLRSEIFDLDTEVRVELERDLGRVKDQQGTMDAILVSGDIAFSGKKDQYDQARLWLEKICEIVGCPKSNVWTVPGNHDVDRDVIGASKHVRLLQDDLRSANEKLDGRT